MRPSPFLHLVSRRRARPLPGTPWLVPFLAATLALALWLGYQALAAARSHRDTAEAALRDYARTAAWQYAHLVRNNLDELLESSFDDVHHKSRWRHRALEVIRTELDDELDDMRCVCPALREPAIVFRYEVRGARLSELPDTLSPAARTRFGAAIARIHDAPSPRRHGMRILPPGALLTQAVAIGFTGMQDDDGDHLIFGFVTPVEAFAPLFQRWFEAGELLPPAITGRTPNDSLLHVAVRGASGIPLFESAVAYPTSLAAQDTLDAAYLPLIIEASIRPDAASRLIIGGLPKSRLPLILGFLVLTLGVGAAALRQIGRERQLARLREDFVSGVSHELRTPIAQIRMFAELQESGKLRTQEEQQRAISVINREARRLTHLVENILRFSRLRRAGHGMVVEEIDVASIVSDVLEAFRPLAASRNMTVLGSADDVHVVANRDALNQVLVNLLDNAVKYGPAGQTIGVSAVRLNGGVRIAVEDHGPGVPANDRQRVFQPYLRLKRDIDARLPGTGIGLAVVAQLATANGGRAWVEDRAGGGARFVVELPAASTAQASAS